VLVTTHISLVEDTNNPKLVILLFLSYYICYILNAL